MEKIDSSETSSDSDSSETSSDETYVSSSSEKVKEVRRKPEGRKPGRPKQESKESRYKAGYCEKCDKIVKSIYHHERTKRHMGIPRINERVEVERPVRPVGRPAKVLTEEEKRILLIPRKRGRPKVLPEVKAARYLAKHPNPPGRPKNGSVKADNSIYLERLAQLTSEANNFGLQVVAVKKVYRSRAKVNPV